MRESAFISTSMTKLEMMLKLKIEKAATLRRIWTALLPFSLSVDFSHKCYGRFL
jgi:hypothetical protein